MVTVQQAFELALQHHQAGRLADAEALYRKILDAQPNHANALHLLGVVVHQSGRHDLAVELIRQSIALDRGNAAAHSNLGEAYLAAGQYQEAVDSYRCALQLRPDYPKAAYNLGNAFKDHGRFEEAIAAYRRALELQPNFAEAQNNLGAVLKERGELDDAIIALRQSLLLEPEQASTHSNLIYTLHFQPEVGERAIAEECQRWNRRFGAPLKRGIARHANERSPERRLRIGYVSPDFREHVVGRNVLPLFRCHDHRQFEIVCYAGAAKPDPLTNEFRQRSDRWRDTLGVGDQALAEIIRQDGVDILVDLAQHAAGNRLPVFGWQPAPVQVSFAGYPESTGVEVIAYRISDRWLESGMGGSEIGDGRWEIGWKHETELRSRNSDLRAERVFLIDSFWCYDPGGTEVAVNDLPANAGERVTFGCLNNFCKVNEPVLRLWARVLRQMPAARLVLLSGLGSHRQRTLEFLKREGVASPRVEFVEPCPRKAYLELYHRLDIVLDTFPYNGHTTSLDALWMGVPVVSLVGKAAVSRAGLSQLSNLSMRELVAHSENEYIEIATRLAGDLPRLAELRKTLRARMEGSILMDAPRFASSIEAAYRAMWRRWCAEAPGSTPRF